MVVYDVCMTYDSDIVLIFYFINNIIMEKSLDADWPSVAVCWPFRRYLDCESHCYRGYSYGGLHTLGTW